MYIYVCVYIFTNSHFHDSASTLSNHFKQQSTFKINNEITYTLYFLASTQVSLHNYREKKRKISGNNFISWHKKGLANIIKRVPTHSETCLSIRRFRFLLPGTSAGLVAARHSSSKINSVNTLLFSVAL